MLFIALDLETTGLNPIDDTIIEIAAIRFNIELEGGDFVMKNLEERSMLINPGRQLEQEVTMITGISNEMLIWKPDFESIKNKVQDFIGDAIIVGHNVLFDISMFESHGIHLDKNTIIDTFELSEIFSQDMESLNLGFLANRYGLIETDEIEHRALTDTKVSIRLLLRYLGEIHRLEWIKKNIWDIFVSRDTSGTLVQLSKICHHTLSAQVNAEDIFANLLSSEKTSINNTHQLSSLKTISTRSLYEISGSPEEELNLIINTFKTHTHILILTPWYKATVWLSHFLTDHHIKNMITVSTDKWCSVRYMREILVWNGSYSRKRLVLILKIAFWLTKTETWLLDELKFYGDERAWIGLFRAQETEYFLWRTQYEENIKNIPILISDIWDWKYSGNNNRYTLIKDIPLLEDIIRRKESQEISFDKLYEYVECLPGNSKWLEIKIHISDMISMIRNIYESIPDRPNGPLITPPGSYGETYFITQKMLWNHWHKWLIHATKTLDQSWRIWKQDNKWIFYTSEIYNNITYIDQSVWILVKYHTFLENNSNIILNINEGKTKITLIPRDVKKLMKPILNGALAFGTHISLPQTKSFLIREYGYTESEFDGIQSFTQSQAKIVYSGYHPNWVRPWTVILTTSQKHARDIGKELRKIHGKENEILIQWLSWGKWKMLSIFKNKIEQTILIGIIDTWRDEYSLWTVAKNIIIAKLPFDPPTDPYFLARTVGMSNNFSEYSEPIVTIRLNTLFERIQESCYEWTIIITDSRLTNTEWWKRIMQELL